MHFDVYSDTSIFSVSGASAGFFRRSVRNSWIRALSSGSARALVGISKSNKESLTRYDILYGEGCAVEGVL